VLSQGNAPHGARAEKLAGASTLTLSEDGTPLAQRLNGSHFFAELAADGALVQVEDGVERRLPPNPDAVFGGVAGRDALLARQQVQMAVRVHARKGAGPAVVRRMPASRPAARRPGGKRTSTRAGPSGDDEPHEPGPPSRRPDALTESRELAASGLADADARSPGPALWSRVRNEAERRAEELRRDG